MSWFLRGKTWAGSLQRADRFATMDEAREALIRAKPMMKPKAFKAACILPDPDWPVAE
jgi:hypothetical protein